MTLSLEAIYKPINDFILSIYKTDAVGAIQFRFDQFGSVLSDDDFIDPRFPELGYSAALAKEKFSDLVNRIPFDCSDGLHINLSQDSIDDTYFFRLLAPSNPSIPNNSFFMVKEEALKRWNNVALESSSGVMLKYRPTIATPVNWYDKSDEDVWKPQSFQITDTNPTSSSDPAYQLLKLKLDDVSMATILKSFGVMNTSPAKSNSKFAAHSVARGAGDEFFEDRFDLHTSIHQGHHGLTPKLREKLRRMAAEKAPTRSVQTNSIQVSFDYCLVEAARQWYFSPFVYDRSWHIPSVPKGQLTMSGLAGSLPWLPIAFMAIRNLNIDGTWTDEDIQNGVQAFSFGPFQVTGNMVNGHLKLENPDLQIAGWLLQDLPELPPNEPPS